MKTIKISLLAFTAVFLLSFGIPKQLISAETNTKITVNKPGPKYVWVPGHFIHKNGKKVWIPGHWKKV